MAGKDNKNALAGAFNEVVSIIEKARERTTMCVNRIIRKYLWRA